MKKFTVTLKDSTCPYCGYLLTKEDTQKKIVIVEADGFSVESGAIVFYSLAGSMIPALNTIRAFSPGLWERVDTEK